MADIDASQTFTGFHVVTDFNPNDGSFASIEARSAAARTVTETGNPDGTLEAPPLQGAPGGEAVEISGGAITITGIYTGWTINGWPVIELTSGPGAGSYIVFSDVDLAGTSSPADAFGDTPICFVKGTFVSTENGVVAIENLKIGDLIITADGRSVPIKWIGRQNLTSPFARRGDGLPVKITAGALGDNVPARDLYVSQNHAFLLQGVLVDAKAMVNGRTIQKMTEWHGDLQYFHIETEGHELILAEGAVAETFIDNASRERFDNYAEYEALYPNAPEMDEHPAGRVRAPRQLPREIRDYLAARADELLGKAAEAA